MDQTPGDTLSDLQLDPDIAAAFQSAGKWARFIAIVFFIFIGFFVMVLVLLLAAGNFGDDVNFNTMAGISPKWQIAIFTLFLVPFTMLVIQLYRFANRTREAIQRQDQEMLNSGLRNLRIYLAVYGVVSLLGLLGSVINIISSF
jgi:hypothetical protein